MRMAIDKLRAQNKKKEKKCVKCQSDKADHYECEGAYLRRVCPDCCTPPCEGKEE